jgi:hypothetical protein
MAGRSLTRWHMRTACVLTLPRSPLNPIERKARTQEGLQRIVGLQKPMYYCPFVFKKVRHAHRQKLIIFLTL